MEYPAYLGTEATSAGNSVEISVGILGHVVIKDYVYALDIHTTTEQIGGNKDTL